MRLSPVCMGVCLCMSSLSEDLFFGMNLKFKTVKLTSKKPRHRHVSSSQSYLTEFQVNSRMLSLRRAHSDGPQSLSDLLKSGFPHPVGGQQVTSSTLSPTMFWGDKCVIVVHPVRFVLVFNTQSKHVTSECGLVRVESSSTHGNPPPAVSSQSLWKSAHNSMELWTCWSRF